MTYTHFGKQADVLKHLLLSEVMAIEQPTVRVIQNVIIIKKSKKNRLIFTVSPYNHQQHKKKSAGKLSQNKEIISPTLSR